MNGRKLIAAGAVALGIAFSAGSATAASPISDSWVELESGRIGAYSWTVGAPRAADSRASGTRAHSPCLQVGTLWRTGPLSYLRQRYRACAPSPGRPKAWQAPVVANSTQPSNGSPARMTAVGMLVPAGVRRLEVSFADGSRRAIPLQDLSPEQARATRLPGYHYAAFVIDGAWCAERMATYGRAGRMLWDSGPRQYPCD